jgi:hypothetical protein
LQNSGIVRIFAPVIIINNRLNNKTETNGKVARVCPPMASDVDPVGHNLIAPLWQNKNAPLKRLLYEGFFVVL